MLNEFIKKFFSCADGGGKVKLISVREGRVKIKVASKTSLKATIDGRSWYLYEDDIRYLMLMDGHTRHSVTPPEVIAFMLQGELIEVSDQVWAVFSDKLSSIMGANEYFDF